MFVAFYTTMNLINHYSEREGFDIYFNLILGALELSFE